MRCPATPGRPRVRGGRSAWAKLTPRCEIVGSALAAKSGLWPCTCLRSGLRACPLSASSDPVDLRHPKQTPYGCFLPDLTRFEALRRAGPDRQHRLTGTVPREPALWQGFNPAVADCGFRAPLDDPPCSNMLGSIPKYQATSKMTTVPIPPPARVGAARRPRRSSTLSLSLPSRQRMGTSLG